MPTTADYLNDLVTQKQALVAALNNYGVEASSSETLNTLVPKVDEVYSKGQTAGGGGTMEDYVLEHIYQHNLQSNYLYAFAGVGWSSTTYKLPKTDKYGAEVIIDANVNASNMYSYSRVKDTIVPIDVSKATNNVRNAFQNATSLVTINKLIVSETVPTMQFQGCSKLENITIEGTIGTDFNFSGAPKLTHDSLMSIINALKNLKTLVSERYEGASADFEGVTYDPRLCTYYVTNPYIDGNVIKCEATSDNSGEVFNATLYGCGVSEEDVPNITKFFYDIDGSMTLYIERLSGSGTLTLGTTNLAKLTDSEKAIATEKGWTLA